MKFRTGDGKEVSVSKLEILEELSARVCHGCNGTKFYVVKINGKLFRSMCEGCKRVFELE